jgi:hypothetical protein
MFPSDTGGEKETGLAEAVHEVPDGVKNTDPVEIAIRDVYPSARVHCQAVWSTHLSAGGRTIVAAEPRRSVSSTYGTKFREALSTACD